MVGSLVFNGFFPYRKFEYALYPNNSFFVGFVKKMIQEQWIVQV